MSKKILRSFLFMFMFALLVITQETFIFASPKTLQQPLKIVVDSYHSHNFINLPPDANLYDYHHLYGFRHLFRYLESRGVTVDEITTGPINQYGYAAFSYVGN